MKQILLTNIGNRNIKFNGNVIDLKDNDGVNFKEFTKALYEQLITDYHGIRPKISIEILPNFIAEIQDIILFGTDQDGELGFQDTIYEAKIIKRILETEDGKNVNILEYKGNPADEFYAYRYFSSVLREFRAAGKNQFYIVNDAGGTPHMKQALKELCEFFFPDRFKVVYTNQQDQKYEVNRWISKKYTLLATLAEFIKNHDYNAALFLAKKLNSNLTENDVCPLSDELQTYIDIVANRINFDRRKAQSPLIERDTPEQLRRNQILQKFVQQRSHKFSGSMVFNQLSEKSKHDVFEIASICQLYFLQQNFTLGTATLYRFMEEVCQSFIESEGKFKISNGPERKQFVFEITNPVKAKFPHLNSFIYGLPILVAYVSLKSEGNLHNLMDFFIKITSLVSTENGYFKGINLLRNHCFLAHDNEPITKEVLDKDFPHLLNGEKWLDQIFQLCDLPEQNIYDQMNDEILELIFNE